MGKQTPQISILVLRRPSGLDSWLSWSAISSRYDDLTPRSSATTTFTCVAERQHRRQVPWQEVSRLVLKGKGVVEGRRGAMGGDV